VRLSKVIVLLMETYSCWLRRICCA